MNYAKCATCHGLNSMGFCQYTACRFPSTESGVVNASAYVPKIVTNADRIRSMTDEELADWLGVYCNGQTAQEAWKPCTSGMGSCEECWLDWLKQEVEDGN